MSSGIGPALKDEVVQYLTWQSSQADERNAGGVLDDLKDEGHVDTVSGEKGEFVRLTVKAIDEMVD